MMENIDFIAILKMVQENTSTTFTIFVALILVLWGKNIPELFTSLINWRKEKTKATAEAKKTEAEAKQTSASSTKEINQDYREGMKQINEALQQDIINLKNEMKFRDERSDAKIAELTNKLEILTEANKALILKNTEIVILRSYIKRLLESISAKYPKFKLESIPEPIGDQLK